MNSKESRLNTSVVVGVDFTNGEDKGVLIVGKLIKGRMTVINAFEGQEAWDLYSKLITKKVVTDEIDAVRNVPIVNDSIMEEKDD